MDMSTAYMRESCEFLAGKGFKVEETIEQVELDEGPGQVHTFTLSRTEQERFILEAWRYPDGAERYYLEIVAYHDITSTSFPLDSWKYKPHQIEFKYYVVDQTSLGLSFILALGE